MKVAVNDAEIFFDVEGTGLKVTPKGMIEKPVCVILHGGPGGDHSAYRPWLSELAQYMQPYCGPSWDGSGPAKSPSSL